MAPASRFENAGTLVKSGGAATSTIAVELDNDGAVEASSGAVALSGGDGAGTQTGSFGGTGATGLVDFTSGSWDLDCRLELHGSGSSCRPGHVHRGGRSDSPDGGRDDDDDGRRNADRGRARSS